MLIYDYSDSTKLADEQVFLYLNKHEEFFVSVHSDWCEVGIALRDCPQVCMLLLNNDVSRFFLDQRTVDCIVSDSDSNTTFAKRRSPTRPCIYTAMNDCEFVAELDCGQALDLLDLQQETQHV